MAPLERGPCRTACRVANRCGLGALRHGCGSWVPPSRDIQNQIEARGLVGKVLLGKWARSIGLTMRLPPPTSSLCRGNRRCANRPAGSHGRRARPSSPQNPDHRGLLAADREALLVQPPTAERLAAAILRLLEDRTSATRLGAAAREYAVKRFSSQRMAEEHLRLFTSLIYERGKSKQRSRG